MVQLHITDSNGNQYFGLFRQQCLGFRLWYVTFSPSTHLSPILYSMDTMHMEDILSSL